MADISDVSKISKQVIAEVERAVVGKRTLLEMMMGNIIVEGYYKVIAPQHIIEIKTKNSFDEYGVDKIKYKLENGLLYLIYIWMMNNLTWCWKKRSNQSLLSKISLTISVFS